MRWLILGEFCESLGQGMAPRFKMLRMSSCFQVGYDGRIIIDVCHGELYPWVLS